MDKRTADALELSIAHWERNVAAETPEGATISGGACALCDTFKRRHRDCAGCPVKLKTGQDDCSSSPYVEAFHRYVDWDNNPASVDLSSAWRAAAQRELDFLKGLRVEAGEKEQ